MGEILSFNNATSKRKREKKDNSHSIKCFSRDNKKNKNKSKKNNLVEYSDTYIYNNRKYKLMAVIKIQLIKNLDQSLSVDFSSNTIGITEDDIIKFLYKILSDLALKVPTIEINENNDYDINLTIFYYEHCSIPRNIRYIVYPNDISNTRLTEYIYIALSIACDEMYGYTD